MVGGQPMDVIFPISVAPIDELGEISRKSGRYERGASNVKLPNFYQCFAPPHFVPIRPRYPFRTYEDLSFTMNP